MTTDWVWRADPLDAPNTSCRVCQNTSGNAIVVTLPNPAIPGAPAHVDVVRCGNCQSVFFEGLTHPTDYQAWDESELTPSFLTLTDHHVELTPGLNWKVLLVDAPLQRGALRVLDVGASTGVLVDYINRTSDATAIGLEPSAFGLAGKRRFGVDIRPQLMHDLIRQRIEPFDLVVSTEVIEHVDDPLTFLREVRALTAGGGVAVITTPNADGMRPDTDFGALNSMWSVGAHRFLLSPGAMRDLVLEAGFESVNIVESTSTLTVWMGRELEPPPHIDVDRKLEAYYRHRVADPTLASDPPRRRVADLIARYNLARSLKLPDELDGESTIDTLLRDELGIDVLDLAPALDRMLATSDFFDIGPMAPYGLARYLFFRGHRDDISEAQRTEMWEFAVAMIAHSVAINAGVNFMLAVDLDPLLVALAARPSGRFNGAANTALASSPELRHRSLPLVATPRPSLKARARRAVGRTARQLGVRH